MTCPNTQGNVLIGDDGSPLLADFGLASFLQNEQNLNSLTFTAGTTSDMKGSPRWMSKELLEGSKPTMPSDMWALGCLILVRATNPIYP